MKEPEKCHIKGGVVTIITIFYKSGKAFKYIICKPSFFDTCEKYIEKHRERKLEFIKINSGSEKEYMREIEAECYRAKEITHS